MMFGQRFELCDKGLLIVDHRPCYGTRRMGLLTLTGGNSSCDVIGCVVCCEDVAPPFRHPCPSKVRLCRLL